MKSILADPIDKQRFLILDGALATELEVRGANLKHPLWSAKILAEQPELIRSVHLDYFVAGADIAITASYQATIPGLKKYGMKEKEASALLQRSVELAQEAREAFLSSPESDGRIRPLVAASVGPYGAYLADGSEYTGNYDLSLEALMDFHRPRLEALIRAKPDLFAFETIPSLLEVEALLKLLRDYPHICAWMSCSCRDGQHICDGTPFKEVVKLVNAHPQIVSVGVNCTAPGFVESLLKIARQYTDKPLVAYPNSGEGWDAKSKCWLPGAEEETLATLSPKWYAAGAKLIGGCCRTSPKDVQMIRKVLKS